MSEGKVTFEVPVATAQAMAPAPNMPDQDAKSEPPEYVVVLHEGRKVLYERVG